MEKYVTSELISMGRGLVGCTSSHIKLWQHIADNNLGWVIILEDDSNLHPKFPELLLEYLKEIPNRAEIVF